MTMSKRGIHGKQVLSALRACGAVMLVVWGCGSSDAEKLRAAQLAERCALNSDCQDPLVCAFERCHKACEEDRDCPDSLRCMKGERPGETVCQLPDESACMREKDCPGEQTCGVDDECRDRCEDDDDCVAAQICALSSECASTLSDKDVLDDEGNIVGGGDGQGGAGGDTGGSGGKAPGNAGDSGSGSGAQGSGGTGNLGPGGEGGDAGTTSSGGSGGKSGAGSGGSAGAGQSGGGSAGTGGLSDYTETPDGVETVDNNDREHTIPAPSTASIYLVGSDQDWFSFTTPDDGHGHVITVTLEQEAALGAQLTVLAGADFSVIGAKNFAAGVSSSAYVSVGPNTTTLFEFRRVSGSGGRADLTFASRPEEDDQEPNNTRDAAAEIALATPVSAQMFIPYVDANDPPAADWYQIDLTGGTATLRFDAVPSAGIIRAELVNQEGAVTPIANNVAGVTGDHEFEVAETDTYFLTFTPYGSYDDFSVGSELPYMSEQYVFQILQ
jgi:hypothetical protein